MLPTLTIYSPQEERANALTHAFATTLAAISGVILTVIALQTHDVWKVISAIVFSISMVLLYLASTLYHSAENLTLKARLKILDHCAIYLLIAGTYTPFTLIGLRGTLGWWLFGIIWSLAFAGIIFKLFFTGRFKFISTLIYIAMGWLVLAAIKPVYSQLDAWTLGWLFAGGAFYTLGTFFYHRESIPYSHAIWHIFCILGSTSHYIAVLAQINH